MLDQAPQVLQSTVESPACFLKLVAALHARPLLPSLSSLKIRDTFFVIRLPASQPFYRLFDYPRSIYHSVPQSVVMHNFTECCPGELEFAYT